MTTKLGSSRHLVRIAAALLIGVAVVLAVAVIPPVAAASYPLASPKAVPAFWLNACLQVLVAAILVLTAVRTTDRGRLPAIVLGGLTFLTLALGLALTDAGSAYVGDSPELSRAAILLFGCAAADLVAAVLVVTAGFRLRRRTAQQ